MKWCQNGKMFLNDWLKFEIVVEGLKRIIETKIDINRNDLSLMNAFQIIKGFLKFNFLQYFRFWKKKFISFCWLTSES